MNHHNGPVTHSQPDDDLIYLRGVFAGLDPAQSVPRSRSRAQPRRRSSAVKWAAVATGVAAAIIAPVVIFTSDSSTVPTASGGGAVPGCEQVAVTTAPSASPPAPSVMPSDAAPGDWFTKAKTQQLTRVLHKALPSGLRIDPAAQTGDLEFGDLDDKGASGRLMGNGLDGHLDISISDGGQPVPPCTPGEVDRRLIARDGTVVDQFTTWANYDGEHMTVLIVTAYRPDGTKLLLRASDELWNSDETSGQMGATATGRIPLTLNEMTNIATTAGLDITTPAN